MQEYLRNALQKNRLPHALIFSGPEGAAQAETALWLAKALFCRERKDQEPCGACADCRLVDGRSHPDLVWLKPEEDSRDIKVEAIRALIAKANLKPFQAPSKLFVIDHADCLNVTAQNAFLKTLEEPAGRATFVLISYANEKLLSTVRSRSQEIRFVTPVAPPAVSEELDEAERNVLDYLLGRSSSHRAPELSFLSRRELMSVLERTMENLREALLIVVGAESVLAGRENRPRKESLAERFSREELIGQIETLAEFKEKLSKNVSTKLALSVLWEALSAHAV